MDPLQQHGVINIGPPITSEERQRHNLGLFEHSVQSTGTFVGIGLALGQVRPAAPKTVDFITQWYAGLHTPHGAAPRARTVPRPGIGTLTYLLPEPAGVIAPEVYEIDPDYFDRGVYQEYPWTDKALRPFLGAKPSQERLDYWYRSQADDAAREARRLLPYMSTDDVLKTYVDPYGRDKRFDGRQLYRPLEIRDIAAAELQRRVVQLPTLIAPPVSIPDRPLGERPLLPAPQPIFQQPAMANAAIFESGVQPIFQRPVTTPQELLQRGQRQPVPSGFVELQVADGSVQPTLIKPVNDKAIANSEGAEGIRKELVHERADP